MDLICVPEKFECVAVKFVTLNDSKEAFEQSTKSNEQ